MEGFDLSEILDASQEDDSEDESDLLEDSLQVASHGIAAEELSHWETFLGGGMVVAICMILGGIVVYELRHILEEAWFFLGFLLVAIFLAVLHALVGVRKHDRAVVHEKSLLVRNKQRRMRKLAYKGWISFCLLGFLERAIDIEEASLVFMAIVLAVSTVGLVVSLARLLAAVPLGTEALDLSRGVFGLLAAPFLFSIFPLLAAIYVYSFFAGTGLSTLLLELEDLWLRFFS